MLGDINELMQVLKKASVEAIEAAKPVQTCFGKVVSVSPLQIAIEQKMTLGKAQLILTRNVTDHTIKITGGNIRDYYYAGGTPDTATVPVSPPHGHAIGEMEITVHNGLVTGDEVLLVRQQEGQKYIVVDRIR